MPVFTGQHIAGNAQLRVIPHQGFPWKDASSKRPSFLETVLACLQAVPIHNLDPIPWQTRRLSSSSFGNQWSNFTGGIAHQLRGCRDFNAMQFLIHGLNRHGMRFFRGVIGRMDPRMYPTYDIVHHFKDHGKEQLFRVLFLGSTKKPFISLCWIKNSFPYPSRHD